MTENNLNLEEFAKKISDLMIEPLDPENPDPQSNGYNWGLAHAEMIFNGADVDALRNMRDWLASK